MPGVPDSGDGGLRAANTRLRELLDERDARIGEQAAENAALRELVTALQSQVADLAAKGGCRVTLPVIASSGFR
jgi:polyhydroxyalkanoate synthesis regulator phasin